VDAVSKATRRIWRKQQEKQAAVRRIEERQARERRLRGFKPATAGDMLAEIGRHTARSFGRNR
jgi:hypothetical protein